MLIVYGKKEVSKKIGSGTFFCPNCDSDQPYWQKTLQQKGHLYWISLLPVGKKLEYVECRSCEEVYQPEVLSFDRDSAGGNFQSDFDLILKQLMVLMMMADDVVDEAEIETLLLVYRELTDHELSRDDVLADVSEAKASGHSISDYLPALANVLTDEAKAVVIHAVFLIAAADGNIDDSEMATLAGIADALEMSEEQLNEALDSLQEE